MKYCAVEPTRAPLVAARSKSAYFENSSGEEPEPRNQEEREKRNQILGYVKYRIATNQRK